MTKEALEAAIGQLDVWSIVFTAVVAVGVVGEFAVSYLHRQKSSQLQQIERIELAQQQERAAKAERELLELRTPRQLTAEQYQKLVEALRASPTKGTVAVAAIVGDTEGAAFAQQFLNALREGGWTVPERVQSLLHLTANGHAICVKSLSHLPPLAIALANACIKGGVPFAPTDDPTMQDDEVRLFIGHK